jgi:DNA-binding transcriptional MocR family regulator
MDSRRRSTSRVDHIVAQVALMLESGAYRVGERLPSVRQAAQEHDVSKNTMAEAYDRLVARGLLEARIGSGYYVAQFKARHAPAVQPHVAEAVDQVSLLREQLDQNYEVRPGDGRLPPTWMEGSELRRFFLNFKMTGDGTEFGYGSTHGFAPLRERIRVQLLERSIQAPLDGILLTFGANHAFDLIIRQFLEPGDVVFVDSPGYYPLFAKLALAKAQIVGIPRTMDGPDLDDMQAKLTTYRPKLFFTQSQAHNPTDGTLSPGIAFGLLQAADKYGFRVVEDDTFADIMPATATRLAALDQLQNVIYVGSFSKTLFASLRSGFIAGRPDVVGNLCDLKMVTIVNTSGYIERFIHGLIQGGHYLRHLRRLRTRLADAKAVALTKLQASGLNIQSSRNAGFYLWGELPAGTDELMLCRKATADSIFLAPGNVFYPERDGGHPPATRINIAYAADERLLAFLKRSLRGNRRG